MNSPLAPDARPASDLPLEELDENRPAGVEPGRVRRGLIVFVVALAASWLAYQLMPFEPAPRKGLALLLFIAIMWLTEAVHTTLTALMVSARTSSASSSMKPRRGRISTSPGSTVRRRRPHLFPRA